MILSDREIRAALEDRLIRITPEPPIELWTSTAIDLTLDAVLVRWKDDPAPTGMPRIVRPHRANFRVTELMNDSSHAEKVPIDANTGYVLDPGRFVLGFTKERIQLPHRSRLAAHVEGKSSLARVGVGVHVTAPTIHAGFGYKEDAPELGSPIQLEIFNTGPLTVVLDIGMAICQLILEEVREMPEKGYKGRFNAQQAFST